MLRGAALWTIVAGVLPGCASIPDVTYNYHPSISTTTVSVAQSISCTADRQSLIITYAAPAAATTYAADDRITYSFPLKAMDSNFADTDFSFTVSDDGRLKGINTSSTGQGEAILKAAIGTARMFILPAAASPTSGMPQRPPVRRLVECDTIHQWGDKVTINYSGSLDLARETQKDLKPVGDSSNERIYSALLRLLPPLSIDRISRTDLPQTAAFNGRTGEYKYFVTLQIPELVKFQISAGAIDRPILAATAIVPGAGTYQLPIPKAAFFGATKFALAISDTGAINSIEYGKSTGAASPFNVVAAAGGQ